MPSKSHRKKHKPVRRNSSGPRTVLFWLCAVVLVAGFMYTGSWLMNRERIERESERYSSLYQTPTAAPTSFPEASDAAPAPTSFPEASDATATPTAAPTPSPTDPMPVVVDIPLPTPDGDTVVYALETPPPVQESFSELLAVNPETVGFLRIGNIVSLPVVQRENDNLYYLDHTFENEPSSEGALFLDGYNRLVPEDDCLIVYGHNMHNGTMFGNLRSYLNIDYFRNSRPVTFDTIYENRTFIPFAAFNASMTPGDSNYLDIRRYLFSEAEFEGFVGLLNAYSEHRVPVDVQYGDKLLLLVTCDYSNSDGRFILALRELRENESADAMTLLLAQAR